MKKYGTKLNILFGQKISDDYDHKYIKIKINFDDNLCLEKTYFLMIKINAILKCFQSNVYMNIPNVLKL